MPKPIPLLNYIMPRTIPKQNNNQKEQIARENYILQQQKQKEYCYKPYRTLRNY